MLGELTPKPCLMGVVLVLASLLVPPILGKSCLRPLAPPVVVSSTPPPRACCCLLPLLACKCPFTPWFTLVGGGLVLALTTALFHRQCTSGVSHSGHAPDVTASAPFTVGLIFTATPGPWRCFEPCPAKLALPMGDC